MKSYNSAVAWTVVLVTVMYGEWVPVSLHFVPNTSREQKAYELELSLWSGYKQTDGIRTSQSSLGLWCVLRETEISMAASQQNKPRKINRFKELSDSLNI